MRTVRVRGVRVVGRATHGGRRALDAGGGLARRLGARRALIGGALVLALVAAAITFWPSAPQTTVTAHFTRAVGLYPGSDVRILGVPVGTVVSVTPEGKSVKVVLRYDGKQKVPADAKAAVMAPSLVSDRYVQLMPAWTHGPAMRDGADIPLGRTAVPVELDRITQSLDDLTTALGPEGANKDGSLSRLLDTSAKNLGGQGEAVNEAVHQLSLAIGTVSGGRDDLFETVKNLQSFTSTLAADDPQVRRLNTDLASVSDQLSGERGDLALALKNLAVALDEVSTFVHDNRTVLTSDVSALSSVTGTIAKDRDALAETLDNAPVALSNLQNAYNPASGTLDTRDNAEQMKHPEQLLCGLVNDQLGKPSACLRELGSVLAPLQGLLGGLTGGTGSLPLGLLAATPSALSTPAAGAPAPATGAGAPGATPTILVDRHGPDPTLAGILGGAR